MTATVQWSSSLCATNAPREFQMHGLPWAHTSRNVGSNSQPNILHDVLSLLIRGRGK